MQPMTPLDDFVYLVNHVLLGEEPTIEDFILLIGTLVAFIAFILWCCFPIQPKDANNHRQFSCKSLHRQNNTANLIVSNGSTANSDSNAGDVGGSLGNSVTGNGSNGSFCSSNGSYTRMTPMLVHNDYIRSGHNNCCT